VVWCVGVFGACISQYDHVMVTQLTRQMEKGSKASEYRCGMLCVDRCGMLCVDRCGMLCVDRCGMLCIDRCGMLCVDRCGMLCVDRCSMFCVDVWSVVCRVWCVECGVMHGVTLGV